MYYYNTVATPEKNSTSVKGREHALPTPEICIGWVVQDA